MKKEVNRKGMMKMVKKKNDIRKNIYYGIKAQTSKYVKQKQTRWYKMAHRPRFEIKLAR